MATVTKPIALDESLNTTENTPRNIADVLADELSNIADKIQGGGKVARKADLTNLDLTGTTNTTGSTIASGTYFYLNGVLVRAKTAIANGATFTENTNYEVVTAGGLNDLNAQINRGSETVTGNGQKTIGALLDDLYAKINFDKLTKNAMIVWSGRHFALNTRQSNRLYFSRTYGVQAVQYIVNLILAPNNESLEVDWSLTTSGNSVGVASDIIPSGTTITLYY